MGKRHLSRHDRPASPNKAAYGNRVVGCTKRPLSSLERSYGLSRHRVDKHCLGPLGIRERRKYCGHSTCKHGLARTRWPHHEHAVPPGCRDHHGTLGDVLVNNISEVEFTGITRICLIEAVTRSQEGQLANASL